MKINLTKTLWLCAFMLSAGLMIAGCKKNETNYPQPQLTIEGSDTLDAKAGETVNVMLNLNAGGGAKSIVVTKGGGFLKEIPLHGDASKFEYTTLPIEAGMEEGEIIEYGFILVNNNNVDSEEVPLTIRVETYDKITLGNATLYNIAIPADGIVASGSTVKLVKGRNYYLSQSLTFETDAHLTIEEGVHVYMNADAQFPVQVDIQGQAQIAGTATAPVVFTSSKVLTGNDASIGDWAAFRLTGSGNTSNNGSIKYLRLEYTGDRGLRLSNVGAATVIDFVQVYKADGEGVMITDGNANLKHIVATDCEGGSYRLGDKYAGFMQNIISVNSAYFDELDDFAIREDAAPVIANLTVLGAGKDLDDDTHGIRIRANAAPKIYNAIVAQFPRRGIRVVDNVKITDMNGAAVFAHSYVFDVPRDPYRDLATAFAGTFDASGAIATNPFNNNVTNRSGSTYTLLTIPGIGVADFVPDEEKTSTFNPSTINAFFHSAAYVGAVKNTAEDWTKGWVKNPDGTIR